MGDRRTATPFLGPPLALHDCADRQCRENPRRRELWHDVTRANRRFDPANPWRGLDELDILANGIAIVLGSIVGVALVVAIVWWVGAWLFGWPTR